MRSIVNLDSGPLGLLMQRRGLQLADEVRAWVTRSIRRGVQFLVPEIADYEVRRELLRIGKPSAIARLDAFAAAVAGRYLAINTLSIRKAAELWADAFWFSHG